MHQITSEVTTCLQIEIARAHETAGEAWRNARTSEQTTILQFRVACSPSCTGSVRQTPAPHATATLTRASLRNLFSLLSSGYV